MIDRGGRRPSINAVRRRCSRCAHLRLCYELDGERIRLCLACIGEVVAEVAELMDVRDRLYEGFSWSEWLDAHRVHEPAGIVGCPHCARAG